MFETILIKKEWGEGESEQNFDGDKTKNGQDSRKIITELKS